MSKGRHYNTPKRHWRKLGKRKRPSYSKQSWRPISPHVLGPRHKDRSWYFRGKKWFKRFDGEFLSYKKTRAIELWFWC